LNNKEYVEFTYEKGNKSIKAKIWAEHLTAEEVMDEIKRITGKGD
jgi:hypothetical protein